MKSLIYTYMHPVVYRNDGTKIREVKNLGWPLRHSREVKRINLTTGKPDGNDHEAEMTAVLQNGNYYCCHWSSAKICKEWLRKGRSLKHARIIWDEKP